MRDLVFIGDAHLDRDDPHVAPFLAFLAGLADTARRVVFAGDLFNLWLGRRELERPHHTAVVEAMGRLRARGVVLDYLEGNRDYRIGPAYAGRVLDAVASDGLELDFGGRRIWAAHGDMANPADRQYRAWRRFSRSAPVWGLFNLLPRARRLRLAESAEASMRRSNRQFKRHFPERAVRAYAAPRFAQGRDMVVLGHFHVEKELDATPGRIYVLPEWGPSRRHLRVGADGRAGFVDSEG